MKFQHKTQNNAALAGFFLTVTAFDVLLVKKHFFLFIHTSMEFNLIRTEECKNSIFHSIHFYEYHQDNLLNHELIFQKCK